MSRLFDRSYRVQVDTKVLQGLAVEFRVDRSLNSNPNTADLTIYNLSQENRKYLQSVKNPVVQIQAGYLGDDPTDPDSNQPSVPSVNAKEPPIIFLGQMREVTNLREGSEWVTRITTGDGDTALKSPIAFSLGPGTSLQNAIKRMITDMRVGVGNAAQAILKGKLTEAGNQFINGFVANGQGGKELERLMSSAGLEYSVQNGNLQVMPIGQPVNNTAIVLSTTTGLIGSPELSRDKKTQAPMLKVRSLLNAKIFPGAKIKVVSDSINGFFRVNRAVYSGQTDGNDWYVDCEATGLGA